MRKARTILGSTFAAMVLSWALAGGALAAPGNNGTVKVDGVPFDDLPNNEPHVGCVFQIDFYGYDQGQLFASVSFELDPPTGTQTPLLSESGIFIGEDSAAGGGSLAGLDASRTYDLTSAIAGTGEPPHSQQGWHVGLTVHADDSQGADVKHKEFWVQGCGGGYPPSVPNDNSDESVPTSYSLSRQEPPSVSLGLATVVAIVVIATFAVIRRIMAARLER
jgi:hypothetical protein